MGRENQLQLLHQQLQKVDDLAICAIAGMGGIGKTELALQYALRYQADYPGGLCWLDSRQGDIGTQIVNYGRSQLSLKIPEDLDLQNQVSYCWRNWHKGKALIIFDDVINYSGIRLFLPPAQPQFKVLITSRLKLGGNVYPINLHVLQAGEALDLLDSVVKADKRIDEELEAAKDLCQWLGYLPLGLELVGRYLEQRPTLTIAKVITRLHNKGLDAKVLCRIKANMTAQLGVAAAFELSWIELTTQAQKVGCLLSLFAPTTFTWELVEQCFSDWDEEDLEEVRDENLLSLNLLQLTKENTYCLHPLIREFFQAKLEEDLAEVDKYKQRFCVVMAAFAEKIPEIINQQQIKKIISITPHLKEVIILNNFLSDDNFCLPFVGLGRFYISQGLYHKAELVYSECLEISQTRFESPHLEIASSQNNLARIYNLQGRYHQAKDLLSKALSIYQFLGNGNSLENAIIKDNLAWSYCNLKDYAKAEEIFKEALEIKEFFLETKDIAIVQSYHNIALLYTNWGREYAGRNCSDESQALYKKAEKYYHLSLNLSLNLTEKSYLEIATIKKNLALLYGYRGNHQRAKKLFLEVLEIEINLLEKEALRIADTRNNLGCLYLETNYYNDAEYELEQAFEIRKKNLYKNHPKIAYTMLNLADIYKKMGKYSQARSMSKEARKILKNQ